MLLFNKEDGDIFNLDNMTRIYPDEYFIRYDDNRTKGNAMAVCDDSDQAIKVVDWIFHRMTFRNGNAILDLDEFREPEKSIYEETDSIIDIDSSIKTETGRTREEIREDGNEEK